MKTPKRLSSRRPKAVAAPAPRVIADHWARIWLLRGLIGTGAWKHLGWQRAAADEDWEDDETSQHEILRAFLGIESIVPGRRRGVLTALRTTLKEAQAHTLPAIGPIQALASELMLSDLERDILLFAVLSQSHGPFRRTLGHLGTIRSREDVVSVLALCLDRAPEEITAACRRRAALAATGLVSLDAEGFGSDLDDWISVLPGLVNRFFEPGLSAATILSAVVKPAQPVSLTLADFTHLGATLAVIRPLLQGAAKARTKGVNVLLYGPPGTGKTALARTLAADLKLRLWEVAVADEDGEGLDRSGRVKALRLVRYLGARQDGQGLVLFDEVEDYFRENEGGDSAFWRTGIGKGYSVDLLEEAPTPTIWITNAIDAIDPALLRRFHFVAAIPPPPAAVRSRLVAQSLAPLGLADHPLAARLARDESLVPGLLVQAAETTALAAASEPQDRAYVYEETINGLLTALGHKTLSAPAIAPLPYDPASLQADTDLAALLAGLKRQGRGTVLCTGVPGTGKTAWGRHVAETLGRPLLTYRASDLLSPYVGVAERQMAAMFARARTEQAVLLLDECDSFLQDRRQARHSWEVTQVNEMLTQMEGFAGVFIATTNLVDTLDAATFRRFDVKVTLKPPTLAQRHALCAAVLKAHGRDTADGKALLLSILPDLGNLTPGDIAAAVRGLTLRIMDWTAADFGAALRAECASQQKATPMGFLAQMP